MAVGQGAVVASARVLLRVDDAQFKRGMKGAERDVDSFSRSAVASMSGFAKAAALTAGAAGLGALVIGAKSAISAASNLGEQINKTSVVFRGSEGDILSWAKTTATSFGISNRAALEAAGTFGNMLVPMGFARDRAGEMSKKMVELAADMASFNNASPEEVLEALRSGLAGETEPLRRFGVFLSDARLKQEALNMGLYDGKGALDASTKAAATYAVILKDTKDAQGDFSETSDSLANQQRILRAQLENLSATAGKALLPIVTSLIKRFNEFVGELQRSKSAQDFLNEAVDTGQQIFSALVKTARDLGPVLLNVVRGVGRVVDAFGGWETAIKAALGIWVFSKLAALTTAFKTLAGAQGIGAATGAISGKGGLLPAIKSLPTTIKIAVVLVGAIAAYKTLKELLGMYQNLEGTTPGGGVQQKGGRWVLDATGTTWTWFYDDGTRGPTKPAGRGRRPPAPIGSGSNLGSLAGAAAGGGSVISTPGGHASGGRGSNWESLDAYDIEARPGTRVVAPFPGKVTQVSQGPSDLTKTASGALIYGDSLHLVASDGKWELFITHLRSVVVRAGQKVKAGQVLGYAGKIGHVHVGGRQLTSKPAVPAASAAPPPASTGGTSDPDSGADSAIVPPGLQLKVAKAELTAKLDDDLAAYEAVEAYLERRLKKEKNVNKRLELLAELKDTRGRIASIKDQMDGADDGYLIPAKLRLRLAKAEATKRIADDLKVLEDIETYLVKRLKKERDVNKKIEILQELASVRRQIAALEEQQSTEADGSVLPAWLEVDLAAAMETEDFDDDLRALEAIERYLLKRIKIEGRLPKLYQRLAEIRRQIKAARKAAEKAEVAAFIDPLAAGAAAAGGGGTGPDRTQPIGKWNLTTGELILRVKTDIESMKRYRAYLWKVLENLDKKINALVNAINRLAGNPRTMKTPNGRRQLAALQAKLRVARQERVELVALMKDLDASIAELEAAAASGPEPEGGTGGADGGSIPDEPTGDSTEDMEKRARELAQQNVLAFLGARTDLFKGYAGNVIAAAFAGKLGPITDIPGFPGSQANGGVTVINNFPQPPPDPHHWSKSLEWDLKVAMG